ncbi:hydroxyneurosporene dehydrogenase [soil metagenome]
MTVPEQSPLEKITFASSIAADVWHPKSKPDAFEWWYFDALSDNGRDAVVIIFLDNLIYSPRYNSRRNRRKNALLGDNSANFNTFPAVAFVYYRDGKPVYRGVNGFAKHDFSAAGDSPSCQIGDNSFKLESASYGSGFLLSINVKLPRNRTLKANFEWLSIEGDFLPQKVFRTDEARHWNLVSSRSDVTGSINVEDRRGKNIDQIHFRGTGYHDHTADSRWLPKTIRDWEWGRAHFSDSSAIFYRYREISEPNAITKLFVVRDGELQELNAVYEEQNLARNIFGFKYPKRIRLQTDENISLRIKQTEIIDQSFFYLRFLSEMTLTLRDGKPRKTVGITEYLKPKALKYRSLDWLVGMRIGRNGKGAFLK